jgi:hypothetical protein
MHRHRTGQYIPDITVIFVKLLIAVVFKPVFTDPGGRQAAASRKQKQEYYKIENAHNKDDFGDDG